MPTPNTHQGFTLIELLVTLALAVILMGVATPNFVAFQRNSELTSAANSLLSGINAARGEAMKRGRNAIVAPMDGSNWESGWVVFVDVDNSATYSSTMDEVVLSREPLPSYFAIKADGSADPMRANPYIRFRSSGFPDVVGDNLTFNIERKDLSGSQKFAETRRVIIAVTGRIRICKPTSDTDANCKLKSS